jgi:hypothetical protein
LQPRKTPFLQCCGLRAIKSTVRLFASAVALLLGADLKCCKPLHAIWCHSQGMLWGCVRAEVRRVGRSGCSSGPEPRSCVAALSLVRICLRLPAVRCVAGRELHAAARDAAVQHDLQRTHRLIRRVRVRVGVLCCAVRRGNIPLSCTAVWPNRSAPHRFRSAQAQALLDAEQKAIREKREERDRKRRRLQPRKRLATKAARALPSSEELSLYGE